MYSKTAEKKCTALKQSDTFININKYKSKKNPLFFVIKF